MATGFIQARRSGMIWNEKIAKVFVKFEKEDLMAVIAIDTVGLIARFLLKLIKEVEPPLKSQAMQSWIGLSRNILPSLRAK